jgi:hypothetical protein
MSSAVCRMKDSRPARPCAEQYASPGDPSDGRTGPAIPLDRDREELAATVLLAAIWGIPLSVLILRLIFRPSWLP